MCSQEEDWSWFRCDNTQSYEETKNDPQMAHIIGFLVLDDLPGELTGLSDSSLGSSGPVDSGMAQLHQVN